MLDSRRALRSVLDIVDVVLTPTVPSSPGRIAESEMIATTAEMVRFTYPWSLAHLPGLSLPCGFTDENLPIGAQLIGPAHGELMLCAVADLYQKSRRIDDAMSLPKLSWCFGSCDRRPDFENRIRRSR
jgi:Asp-tRNA(Asn)/Glu-tRNA(Gln) amidotransferase A subunit family amidase